MIIGIFGNNRSGKTTIAEHLTSQLGFNHVAFATKLKELVKHNMHMDDSWKKDTHPFHQESYGYRLEWVKRAFGEDKYIKYLELIKDETEKYKIYRHTLEFVGTECCRHGIDPEIWRILLEYHLICNTNEDIVIDDIRFPNEYNALTRHGAIFIRVKSPLYEEPPGTHESQIHVDSFKEHHIIINDYTEKPLREVQKLIISLQYDNSYSE